jgi:VWFA-related protein
MNPKLELNFHRPLRPQADACRKAGEFIPKVYRRLAKAAPCRPVRWLAAALLCAGTVLGLPPLMPGHPGKPYIRRSLKQPPRADLAVHIPVVVRDRQGHSIGGLTRRDFRLLVDGQVQTISDFAENIVLPPPTAPNALAMPRYIALYFDDLHMDSSDIIRATDGADGYFAKHLGQWDRLGIFTASGQDTLAFTHNWAKIHQTLLAIHAHPPAVGAENGCPAMTDFEAYLIHDLHQPMAREVGIEGALQCAHQTDPGGASGRPSLAALRQAARRADAQARRVVATEEQRSAQFLNGLDRLIDQAATLPDPRRIVVVSPGFLIAAFAQRVDAMARRAAQLNITISTIDLSRQLSQPSFTTRGLSRAQAHQVALAAAKYRMTVERASVAADVLMELAGGTGGNFVPNTYDPEFAFPMAVPLPHSHYVLTFYVPPYRANGSFHRLQVELLRHPGLSVQAQDSYFAPGHPRKLRSAFRRGRARTPLPVRRARKRPST